MISRVPFVRGGRSRLLSLAAAIALSTSPAASQPDIPRTSPPAPDTDVFLVSLQREGARLTAGTPRNATARPGYDNQPSFARDGRTLYYTANRGDGHTDIWAHDLTTNTQRVVKHTTPESEYSAFPTADGRALTVIRVEADSTQRLWYMPLGGGADRVLFPDTKPVGYFAQPDDSTWVLFVLGSPVTLQVGYHGRGATTVVGREIGRSLHRIPGTTHASVVQKGSATWRVMEFDPRAQTFTPLVELPPRSEDVAWLDGNTLLVGSGTKLLRWTRGATTWDEVADFAGAGLRNITRLAVSPDGGTLAFVADVPPR